MLYKKVGFPLNVRNNPSPADTVMEDRSCRSKKKNDKKKKRKSMVLHSMHMMQNFTTNMDKTMN